MIHHAYAMSGAFAEINESKLRLDDDLQVKHHFSPGVYGKEMHLHAGWYAETHEHKYDHMSVLASGVVEVTIDGEKTLYQGFNVINIAAGKKHRIDALTDSIWLCVHATDETDPEMIDRVLIKES